MEPNVARAVRARNGRGAVAGGIPLQPRRAGHTDYRRIIDNRPVPATAGPGPQPPDSPDAPG